jgi:Flp pilus assembly pilin Flp
MKSSVLHRLTDLSRLDDGQDLLEYAMLGGLIAIVAVGAVGTLGNTIDTVLWQVIAAASF